jgi:tRNA nucleotidyltransferase (CCA-adding enzyme)
MRESVNFARQIEQYFPQQALELIKTISREANRSGQRAYLVGGAVRDMFLDYSNFDLDLVIEGNAVKLAQQIAKVSQANLIVHPRFGTAKLSYSKFTLDMTTVRSETYAKPGALPTVTPGTINDDLFRRDFSINAMAISLNRSDYGELIDPCQGKSDLESHLIRILYPKSFSDDATRIIRAIRYEQRLGFKLEPQTAQLLKKDIPALDAISGDRIRHELELILRETHPEYALRRLGQLGVLHRISPYLKGNGWVAEKFEAARLLNKPSQLSSLYLCLLVYPLHERENEQLIQRLNPPAKLARELLDTLRLKNQLYLLDKPTIKHSEIFYLLHEYSPLAIQTNALASDSTAVYSNLDLFLTKLRYVKTTLNGEELKRRGISAGPELGEILQTLHRAKLDGKVKTRAEEEKLALLLKP